MGWNYEITCVYNMTGYTGGRERKCQRLYGCSERVKKICDRPEKHNTAAQLNPPLSVAALGGVVRHRCLRVYQHRDDC